MRLPVSLEVFFQDPALADRIGSIKQAGHSAGGLWGHEGRAGYDARLGLAYIPLLDSRASLVQTREWLGA